ncbi:SprT-like domain-containing protein [Salinicola aestuarinus]|uniref:SprT family zinc-dependent metalloprotease n=1 Tax=Salinicola aestuarinus TaxID=1949082 RepID=UPI000DA1C27E|nr:SprT-like domain-containing protein [Salinicola aestuarinus]
MSFSALIPALPTSDAAELEALDETALRNCLMARVEAAWRLAREVHPELPRPHVWFDLRGRSAGQAHYGRGGLRFNTVLLADNRRVFFDEIVAHEMAHWLVFHLKEGRRARPHGREWQRVMRDLFGVAPNVTHRLDVSQASPQPYLYRCHCDTRHAFTSRRHAMARRGSRYACRRCGAPLVFDRRADAAETASAPG